MESGKSRMFTLISGFRTNYIFYSIIVSIILSFSSSSLASAISSGPGDKGHFNGFRNPASIQTEQIHSRSIPTTSNRLGKQFHFFEWLFGQPVPSNSTHHPHVQHNGTSHNNPTTTAHANPNSQHSEPLKYQEFVAFEAPFNNSVVYYPSINNSDPTLLPSGPIYAKPRTASNPRRSNASRQIEITDVQASIGTELNEANLNSNPSQVNLQDELDAIDRLEKNLTDHGRKKRESETKNSRFRQLQIPYGSPNPRINNFSKRQLFMTPEQQMLALRQQQEIAAATMLQQHLLSATSNNNRYNNRYVDDYYDDDSSYEDSDERYDDFNRYGLNPIAAAAALNRAGGIFGGIGHPMGLGRRSLPDDKSDGGNQDKKRLVKRSRTRKASGRADPLGSISKSGRWETIEDYDLSSDFNRLQSRRGKPEGTIVFLGDSHKELDESDEVKVKSTSFRNRGRTGIMGRQDVPATEAPGPTEGSSSVSETSTTLAPTSAAVTPDESSSEDTESGESNTSSSSATDPNPTEATTSSSTVESTSTTEEEMEASITTTTGTPSTKPSTTKKPKPAPTPKPVLPPFHQTLNCRCGVQSVRGEMADDGTIIRTMVNPWLVAVSTKQKHLCSGSIINNKYILTSKQCVKGAKGLIVTAGMGSRASKNFTVTKISQHESRNIALLKIKPGINPNHAMRPICLPIKKQNAKSPSPSTGTLVTFKRNSSKNSPIHLVQTEVPMLRDSNCGSSTGDLGRGTICPGPPASLKCGGDTGGLLQVYQRGYSYEQIGVVSNTVGCRANKAPGVYTDVRKSVKWILFNTKDAKYCRKPKVSPADLMNTKRSEVEDDNAFLGEERGEDEFGFEDEALQVEDEDEEEWD